MAFSLYINALLQETEYQACNNIGNIFQTKASLKETIKREPLFGIDSSSWFYKFNVILFKDNLKKSNSVS